MTPAGPAAADVRPSTSPRLRATPSPFTGDRPPGLLLSPVPNQTGPGERRQGHCPPRSRGGGPLEHEPLPGGLEAPPDVGHGEALIEASALEGQDRPPSHPAN
jgi:hypothetical protein